MRARSLQSRERGPKRADRPAGRRDELGPAAASVLELQRSAGNAGVTALIQRQEPAGAAGELLPAPPEYWTEDEVKAMQKELRRMRLYAKLVDGDLGFFTAQGLVEAFGGDDWKTMAPEAVISALKAATRPRTKHGGRGFRYAELFKDGVLDVSFGVGYTEEEDDKGRLLMAGLIEELDKTFVDKGYKEDAKKAGEIMERAGRPLGKSAFGRFYVKENAMIYSPPAGRARPVHVLIRLLANPTGTEGAQALAAFTEGMTGGDVAYYSGHGRYGSGPDFDRNFARFTLYKADGTVWKTLTSYDELEVVLENEHPRRNAWQQFLWRVENDKIRVELTNAGNLRLSEKNVHRGEFGANLIYWAMEQTGTKAVTGAGGALATAAEKNKKRRYRVLVFDGCRTKDYEKLLRGTPGFDTRTTDIVQTTRSVGFMGEAETFMAFVEGIVAQYSAEKVIKDMNEQMRLHEAGYTGAPYAVSGLGDNPSR